MAASCGSSTSSASSATAATSAAAATSVAAATSSEPVLKGSITYLNHRTDLNTPVFQNEYVKKFEALHPGVTVTCQAFTDYQGTLQTRMNTQNYGDVQDTIGTVTVNQFPQFFLPLGTTAQLSQTYDYCDNFAANGTQYGLSTGADATGMAYSAPVFKQAGITSLPTTPDEFIADLQAIKAKCPGVIPLYTNYSAGWPLTNWPSALSSWNGDVNWNIKLMADPNAFAKGSLEYQNLNILYTAVKDGLVEKDPITSDWETSKTDLGNNKIGVMYLGSWVVQQCSTRSTTNSPQDVQFMPVPYRDASGNAYMEVGTDSGITISKYTKNPDLAKAWLYYFLSQYPNDSGMMSPLKGAALPSFMSSLQNVKFITDTAMNTTQAATWNNVQKDSGMSFGDPTWLAKIVNMGLGTDKTSFDSYMAQLNTKWAAAVKSDN
jgi:ABC-type glycerol-3-phosphate transport system substrate-binding protein